MGAGGGEVVVGEISQLRSGGEVGEREFGGVGVEFFFFRIGVGVVRQGKDTLSSSVGILPAP